jgi:hypothetical protein
MNTLMPSMRELPAQAVDDALGEAAALGERLG